MSCRAVAAGVERRPRRPPFGRGGDVLCGDESPVNVLGDDLDDSGEPVAGAPHAATQCAADIIRHREGVPELAEMGWHGHHGPWTNNASEQALRSPKRRQAVSGYSHTTDTLHDDLRIRSYLASARRHGIRVIDAIHRALTGNPWFPTVAA